MLFVVWKQSAFILSLTFRLPFGISHSVSDRRSMWQAAPLMVTPFSLLADVSLNVTVYSSQT
jgi:hypothetical protein